MPVDGEMSVRDWMCGYFAKNEESFEKKPALELNWDKRNVMVGAICLGLVRDAVICTVAGSEGLGEAILERAAFLIRRALARFGAATDLDMIDLGRVELDLAARVGSVLSPAAFDELSPEVPFDVFPRYMDAPGAMLEECNACKVLWALIALLEANQDEFEIASGVKMKVHSDYRSEMKMVSLLPRLVNDAGFDGWDSFEQILARWLNPLLKSSSYASNFQEVFAAALSLFWSKYQLRKLDRALLIGTYLGDTMKVTVEVGS